MYRQQRGKQSGSDTMYRNQARENSHDNNCDKMRVPTKMVGRIIGRGGSRIEEIRARSSSRVTVTNETDGNDTFINISGSDDQIDRAKQLIFEIIEDKPKEQKLEFNRAESSRENRTESYRQNRATSLNSNDGNSGTFTQTEERKEYNWFEFYNEIEAAVAEEWNKLPPIVKDFYEEHPEISALTDEEVETFRMENNNIVVSRVNASTDPIPKPVQTFVHAFHNYPEILKEIDKAGFVKPSPIQCQLWPILLSGEDVIGIAQTGTGKTLAFLLPALIHIDGQTIPREERGGPAVLIMAPTRELALQIDKEVRKYEYKGITSVCVYGGGDRKGQIETVTRGVDIVIATPGRMNDLNVAGYLNVKSITYVVLDEADRMLDMGFEPQIRKVMYSLRPTRQCIMTSATWPPGVRRLADSYMDNPIQVYVGSLDLAATHSVTQVIQIIDEKDKESCFMNFARNMGPDDKVIVFCGTKAKADYLSVECHMVGILNASLHGNKDQCDREQAVADIGDGSIRILIATDLAARGLDIDDVTHVINYDFPKNIEEYVHRVGRTGRAGKCGESISYFTRNDWAQAAELIKILEEAEQFVPEELHTMAERYKSMLEKREQGSSSGGNRDNRRFGRGNRRW